MSTLTWHVRGQEPLLHPWRFYVTPVPDRASSDALTCSCPRSSQELRRREELSLGRRRVIHQYQCKDCGAGHGIWSREPKSTDLPPWDHSLPNADQVELEAPEAVAWWESYREYLASPQWQEKRQRVLEREIDLQRRDPPYCQCCWRRPAVMVHHQSYRRLRREPLVDLVAVCGICHDALHDSMAPSD